MLVVDLWSVMIMVFSVRKLVFWLILPVIAILSVSAGVFAADTVRIMPLGDSITKGLGSTSYNGYRKPLYIDLIANGYNVDFVGGETSGDFADPDHEGHSGWHAEEDGTIYDINDQVYGWLVANPADIVLLHIGTNDITWGDQDANEVGHILDEIDRYSEDIIVILAARIIKRNDTKNPQTIAYNNNVEAMALARIAGGDDIILVDMENALVYPNDLKDEVHPNDNGYAKMATVWYNALVGYFSRFNFAISGYAVELDGNTPVEGVLIQTDDNDINSVTDANGYYELLVDYGWSGVATPQKEGRVFEPNGYIYTDVNQDYNDMNYIVTMTTFKIAGFVFEQDYVTPISNVNVSAENGGGQYTSRYGGGSDITDANGYYEVVVDYNWSGTVTPGKTHYTFNPNSRYYEDVNRDYTADQNYTGNRLDFRITGYIKNECNVPIEGVLVDANNGGDENITDVNGFYEVWVDSAWSGTVTPSKTHYTFDPNSMSYANVLGDIADQNYVANNIYDLDCDGTIGYGDVAVISENWLTLGGPDVPSDFYKDNDNIVNFLDFADFANVWGD